MRTIFSTVLRPQEPALTVESLAITATTRPPILPSPVITPSAGSSGSSAVALLAGSSAACTRGRSIGTAPAGGNSAREVRCWHRNRLSVVPWVASTELYGRFAVVEHGLAVAEVGRSGRLDLEEVPQGRQLVAGLLRDRALHLHIAPFERPLGEPSRLQRLLDGHAEVRDVHHELRVGLRLVPAAHDPEADPHVVLLHEGRDDRVQRPLAAGDGVRLPRLEREQVAAVLQHEAGVLGRQARPEAGVVALDERDDVPLAVHDAEVDGVASARGSDPGELRG